MRRVVFDRFGGTDVLRMDNASVPEPAEGEVLVRIRAAGVNPIDWMTRSGTGVPVTSFPAVPGWDLAGSVVAAGPGAGRFGPGDEVFGLARFPGLAGAYAEYAVVPEADLAMAPAGIDPLMAGAAPMAGLTAWQSICGLADVRPGQRVLVHGAAGGVGHLAVQLARIRGAVVVATASPRNHDFLTGLGAAEVIDYSRPGWVMQRAQEFDAVLDPVGGEVLARLVTAVRPGGIIVTLKGGGGSGDGPGDGKVRIGRTYVGPDAPSMAELAAFMEAGTLTVRIQRGFALDDVRAAHAEGERGHVAGKLVLVPE